MEKVQFQLESTIPELKDLYEKGLFTKHEIDQITRRRTAFETSLIRPVTRKDDFFKYAEYEINLEKLRKIRWKKLNYHINPPPPSASTYSIPRRTLYILKRATAKFPGDLAVWLAYVEYAAKEGMTKIVVKGLNSALQHLPLSSTLYLLLAYHHLHPGSPLPRSSSLAQTSSSSTLENESSFTLEGTGPARTTLLLGLRMLPTSHLLWREYIKLELGWVEALRRRWNVLGINIDIGVGEGSSSGETRLDAAALDEGEGAFGPEGESARKAILSGQLVEHALKSGLERISPHSKGDEGTGMEFRDSVISMLRKYPSVLRARALEIVYADLERIDSNDEVESQARLTLLVKGLYDQAYDPEKEEEQVLTEVELVEEMGKIGKAIRKISKQKLKGWSDVAGKWLAMRVKECEDNSNLRKYLYSTLGSVIKSNASPPDLLNVHLDLVRSEEPEAYLATARSHARAHPSNPGLQLRRVQAETELEPSPEIVRKACGDVIKAVTIDNLSHEDQNTVESIWLTWVDWEERQYTLTTESAVQIPLLWKRILRDSLRQGSTIPRLHSTLLSRYYTTLLQTGTPVPMALSAIISTYLPNPDFFRRAFGTTDKSSGKQDDLMKVYTAWRPTCRSHEERVEAVLVWAQWLIEKGKGKEARDAVEVVRMEVGGDEAVKGELDSGWRKLLDENVAADDMDAEEKNEKDGEEIEVEDEDGDDESNEDEDSDSELKMF